jgi:uncharacterized protein (DUF58 family)
MQERYSTESVGLLLGKFGILVLFGGFIMAAWSGQIVLTIILGMAIAAGGLTWLWSRWSLEGVSCNRELSESRAFPGESVTLNMELVNRKLLPMPWVQVDEEIPLELFTGAAAISYKPGFGLLSKSAALLWYSKIKWSTEIQCSKRGYYPIGPVEVTSGDVFGFHARTMKMTLPEQIIVYPQIFDPDNLNVPSSYPLGQANADRMIFEDPARIMGVRDYCAGDSMKRIHWKASARQQSLQVKVLEPTTTIEAAIFLALDSYLEAGVTGDDYECGISSAAGIAKRLLDQSNPAGFFVNSRLADSGLPARIMPGDSPHQLVSILEAMAKITKVKTIAFDRFLDEEHKRLPWGTTIVLVAFAVSESLKSDVSRIKNAGYRVLLCPTGTAANEDLHKDGQIAEGKA